ncbi:P-loop containing nucleoside triphosphate hydrolase protein [Rickenella mellea]|uniref:DNA 3'-5' helicase n=1 Tax=Rickenella mellea TaxID=50990 RepID=A0A4Y7PJW1_9AGAM|nr:P-loop containing nucleoside triphosphate hydrolase protein [Rickenella mellea]
MKFRVGFVSPETATSRDFNRLVFSNDNFRRRIIMVVIDEAHTIHEWGGEFRPECAKLGVIRGRLPTATLILAVSATLPEHVITDIQMSLQLSNDAVIIEMANNKPNLAISVRFIKHPDDSFADLLTIIPPTISTIDEIKSTIIYCNDRAEAEEMSDMLRNHLPHSVPRSAIEHYHRHIGEHSKRRLEKGIDDGTVRIVPATEALGMGLDLRKVYRVACWKIPPSFCALVQRAGRAGRVQTEPAEFILFVPKSYKRSKEYLEAQKALMKDKRSDELEGLESSRDDTGVVDGTAGTRKGGQKRGLAASKDQACMAKFIVTERCHWEPWDEFFQNERKRPILYPPLAGIKRCCDNCDKALFPVETISVTNPGMLKAGRRAKAPEEQAEAVRAALKHWRSVTAAKKWPSDHFMSGRYILSDDILNTLASTRNTIRSVEDLARSVRWHWEPVYGQDLVNTLQSVYGENDKPPTRQRRTNGVDNAEIRTRFRILFDVCLAALESCTDDEGRARCKLFQRLPNSRVRSFAKFLIYTQIIHDSIIRTTTPSLPPQSRLPIFVNSRAPHITSPS